MSATTTRFIDFAALKTRVTIEQVIAWLGVELKPAGNQLRGHCPICKSPDARAFVVTPSKGLWFCQAERVGGDMIKLVSALKKIEQKDAAALIQQTFAEGTVNSTVNSTVSENRANPGPQQGMKPLDYLVADNEAVQALGISPDTCRAFGAGYAPKGVLRGRLAIPIHARDGTLLAYCGRAVRDEQPALFFHNFDPRTAIMNQHRITDGDLFVCRDPLDVLKAHEGGIENCVAFLAPITAQSLEMLASLMDQAKCETCELF